MNPRKNLILLAGILAGLTPTVHGTLLLSESFDYYPLASPSSSTKFLRGDSNHNGGIGWADEWKAVSGDPDATGGLRLDLSETSIPYPDATTLAAEPAWQVRDDVATGVTFRSIRLLTNSTDANMGKGIRIDELRVANTWSDAVYGMTFADPDAQGFVITDTGFNGSNEFEVTVEGLTPGTTYFLQRDPDLSGGFATTVDTKVAASSTEVLTDATPPADKAFCRVSD